MMTACCMVGGDQYFRETCWLYVQSSWWFRQNFPPNSW